MRIVITGWLGYIGSSLVPRLISLFPGCELVLIDKAKAPQSSPLPEGHSIVQGDILNLDLESIFKKTELVIHLAALTDPAESFQNARSFFEINTEGTIKISGACLKTGSALFFPSTTSVYGKTKIAQELCGSEALNAQSPYAQSKLKAENYLLEKASRLGLKFTIARFGSVFGVSPHMQYRTALNRFCKQAAEDGVIKVWSSAREQVRPYLEIGDALAFICFLIKRRLYAGCIYNVATLNASAGQICEILKSFKPDLKVRFINSPAMNSFSYETDISRSLEAGFSYSGSLENAIKEMMAG